MDQRRTFLRFTFFTHFYAKNIMIFFNVFTRCTFYVYYPYPLKWTCTDLDLGPKLITTKLDLILK